MSDTFLVISKLEQLAEEALNVSNEFEKAAIFGAVRILTADMDANLPDKFAENIERARWSICAILGYDVTNGVDQERHLGSALSALVAIKQGLDKG